MRIIKILSLSLFFYSFLLSEQPAELGRFLSKKLPELKEGERATVLIYLKDKGNLKLSREISAASLISQRSINRRMKVRGNKDIVDFQDLPVNNSYILEISSNVVKIRHALKWFNAVSAEATREQIGILRNLPFVMEIELVGKWGKPPGDEREESSKDPEQSPVTNGATSLDYGTSFTQASLIKIPQVHDLGIYGQGLVIGVFDNGFRLLRHEAFSSMEIIATYDFVDHKESVIPTDTNDGSHGVNTLSTIGGYKPSRLIGPAFKASYILARTENTPTETPIEEDNWAAAIQWADSIGVDITSTSLGYSTYDSPYTSWTWADMDGNTTLISRAADRAVWLGIVVVNSAGNGGAGDGIHNTLGAPADGDSVIAAGAVTSTGVRSSFSSVGPTSDGQIKPDIMAMGSGVKVASSTDPTGYGLSNGTSFSCPLSAGVAALILCANPALTPMEVRDAMRLTASLASAPNNLMGYGILNVDSAIKYFGALPMGAISGSVYNDTNHNGTKDPGENGIEGRKVYISGSVADSALTDMNGDYGFTSLPIGDYSVSQEQRDGWLNTQPGGGYFLTLLHAIDSSGLDFGNTYAPDTGLIFGPGWRISSLPHLVADHSIGNYYQISSAHLFTFEGAYIPQDTVPQTMGYWVNFDSTTRVIGEGEPRFTDTLDVYKGWNIVGSISVPVYVSDIIQIPPENVISSYLSYDNAYVQSAVLYPYVGYWVKVKESGKIILK